MEARIDFLYLQDPGGSDSACVSFALHPGTGKVHFGWSVCHKPLDEFKREMGRSLAVGRMVTNPHVLVMSGDSIPIKVAIAALLSKEPCQHVPHALAKMAKQFLANSKDKFKVVIEKEPVKQQPN